MGSKKKNLVIEKGVEKVFEDTPFIRATKTIDNLNKQVDLNINRLEMIIRHLPNDEVWKIMDMFIAVMVHVTARITKIRDDKMGWNIHEEVVIDEEINNRTARENQQSERRGETDIHQGRIIS